VLKIQVDIIVYRNPSSVVLPPIAECQMPAAPVQASKAVNSLDWMSPTKFLRYPSKPWQSSNWGIS